jgi:hypothetical protein
MTRILILKMCIVKYRNVTLKIFCQSIINKNTKKGTFKTKKQTADTE